MFTDDGILVLTTREKSWWPSMQEIIPAIERVWTRISQSKRENVRMLRVPLAPEVERSLLTSSSRLKRIIITAATPGTVGIALLLRVRMKARAPIIIYIHGDATEGFHALGALGNTLTETDMFVVSCEAEADATRYCFPNAQVSVIPFPLADQFKLNSPKMNGQDPIRVQKTARLAYVGRVSEQKNLTTLLLAIWILRTWYSGPRITLDVYGAEDHLGSPNMGLKYRNYGAYLEGLADLLALHNIVKWHGSKPRGWLFDNVHLKPHILVSPTLHSDENFGSSVLASLVSGHRVVTTAWGGHLGFKEWFPGQLALVPVHRSTMGPVVNPALLANALLEAVTRIPLIVSEATLSRARAEYSEGSVTSRTLELLSRPPGKPVSLEKSGVQRHIDERRAVFGGTRKIFADYKDPAAQIFFEAYGMKEPLTFEEHASYLLSPWTSYSKDVLRVVDPHRGHQSFSFDPTVGEVIDVALCPSMDTCRLPKALVKRLVAQGYAFAVPAAKAAEVNRGR